MAALFLIGAAEAVTDEDIALECRFSSGLTAVYMVSRGEARVRRVDLLQARQGHLRTTAEEYRLIFDEPDSAYRIDVVVDRANGNTRRVFGTRENMDRMPDIDRGDSGLVFEAGQCREQAGSRAAMIGAGIR